jgi:hypothetical protein
MPWRPPAVIRNSMHGLGCGAGLYVFLFCPFFMGGIGYKFTGFGKNINAQLGGEKVLISTSW